MLIVAEENIKDYKMVEYKDIVFGVCNASEGAGFRQGAVKRMTDNAEKLGANAIVNFRIKIYINSENQMEATAYGNAVITDPLDGAGIYKPTNTKTQPQKVNLDAYTKKVNSPQAQIHDINGYKFAVCPQCGTKYRVETDEKGEVHIKGFDDVDDSEPGLQVFCLRCGTKFTVPEKK